MDDNPITDIKAKLHAGITLDTNPNAIYSGLLTHEAAKIVEFMRELHEQGKKAKIQIGNRVYVISDGDICYYSLHGRGVYRWVRDWRQVYDFLTRPVRDGRFIKILVRGKEVK